MMANFGAGGQTGFVPDMMGNKPSGAEGRGREETHREGRRAGHAQRRRNRRWQAQDAADAGVSRRPEPLPAERRDRSAAIVVHLPGRADKIQYDPPQTKVWQDHRDGGNSPWSAGWSTPPPPPGNTWTVKATFSEPGTYVLRALASDGGLIAYEDVTVTVVR